MRTEYGKPAKFDLRAVVEHLENEYGVGRETILVAIEQAIQAGARKNPDVTNDLKVEISRDDLRLRVTDTYVVSDEDTGTGFMTVEKARRAKKDQTIKAGDVVEVEIPAALLGRVCARTSRQLIMQKIREAKREGVFETWKDHVGELVTGTVSNFTRNDVIVTVGNAEMVLPRSGQIRRERYEIGDQVKAVVERVDRDAKGSSVVLSRSSRKFLEAIFRLEVSEIDDGTVEIVGVARDPGWKAKVAVRSNNERVDPVGACVGRGGSRIKAVVASLGGERVDMVRWDDEPRQYIASALAPAKLEKIAPSQVVPGEWDVVAGPDQYALALGRSGQNVRLASELVGARINVRKSAETMTFEEKKAEAVRSMSDLFAISTADATAIVDAGYLSADGIAEEDEASFIAATGLDEVTAKGVYAAAKEVAGMISLI